MISAKIITAKAPAPPMAVPIPFNTRHLQRLRKCDVHLVNRLGPKGPNSCGYLSIPYKFEPRAGR